MLNGMAAASALSNLNAAIVLASTSASAPVVGLSTQQAPIVAPRAPSLPSLALPALNPHISAFGAEQEPHGAWHGDDAKVARTAQAVLNVVNLPRDLTLREAQFIFALAPDLLSLDVSRNAVSGDVSISARFAAAHSAQAVGLALERRPDIFGPDLKTNVQSFAPFSTQHSQRSIYQQRPLFSDSTWSQQPISPLTPATADALGPRRSSSLVAAEQIGQISLNGGLGNLNNGLNNGLNGLGGLQGGLSGNLSGTSTPHSASFDANMVRTTPPSVSPHGSVSLEGHKMPPPNPADQNPPCNTLYVGNLPPDTSENELKDLFSRQPGYRRLCFRTKQNGPMCFVEFEDEVYAGKTLVELYGVALSNSVKGGIRLSYSKNPLGVKSRAPRAKNVH